MTLRRLSVLMAAAECAPFAKVGGLGDVIGSLPRALARHGIRVSVILPKYGSLSRTELRMERIASFRMRHAGSVERIELYRGRMPGQPVDYYFIGHPIFSPEVIYIQGQNTTNRHNARARSLLDVTRFLLFSHAVVEALAQKHLSSDIIHCHDWHTAQIPNYLDEVSVMRGSEPVPTVLTIHNLGNQGAVPRRMFPYFGSQSDAPPALLEDYYDLDGKKLNCLKLGILSADRITTVSPSYAEEILTHRYGAKLESFLLRRKRHLSGIVNGIDTELFNPATDRFIARQYTKKTVRTGKQSNKAALQRLLKLPQSDIPLIGMVSRLVPQKGFDLVAKTLPSLLRKNSFQVAVLGTGEPAIERRLKNLQSKHRKNVAVRIGFDLKLAQLIYAGSDMFLMPSRFEPCGLGQLIAMRYGTVPIVRETGGLKDTVANGKTGFVFPAYSKASLTKAVHNALRSYADKKDWQTIVSQCMLQDFSWDASAQHYSKLYSALM